MLENKLILDAKSQVRLGKVLVQKLQLDDDNADRLSNSLVDISKSLNKIYADLLPNIYELEKREEIVHLLWDLKDEFRHIDYHIKDASLDELSYIKE